MESIAYGVPGIDEEAGERLDKHLRRLPGVQDVTVWLSEQQIDVRYDPEVISAKGIEGSIQRLGYMTQHVPRARHWAG